MTDEAGPIAEIANATGEVVRTAREAGGYLAAVFGSVPHDLVGVLGGGRSYLQNTADREEERDAAGNHTQVPHGVLNGNRSQRWNRSPSV
jgi:hypothetical protein